MNTTFRIDPCYELEITSDGTLTTRDPLSCSAVHKGAIGVMLHHTDLFPPRPNGDPALDAATPVSTTKVAIFLKRNQARAIASALLSAVSESAE